MVPVDTGRCSDGTHQWLLGVRLLHISTTKQYWNVEELEVVGGCSSVVIEHWRLKPATWVRFPVTSLFLFQPEFRIKTYVPGYLEPSEVW